ncbi:hypothetical protein OS493_012246 [Desmophyllum pertusum]|uniref:Uncharacterized protein n=1 Tax=Desmophyllum pertusum TaxID=174260 RepID=A0A9X0D501_9CNID|nr:hypothetical protein OS493_012246 [Desmophyllum pertusum]
MVVSHCSSRLTNKEYAVKLLNDQMDALMKYKEHTLLRLANSNKFVTKLYGSFNVKNSTDEESKSSQSQQDKEKEDLTDEDSNGGDDFSQRPKETDESDDGDTIKLPDFAVVAKIPVPPNQ